MAETAGCYIKWNDTNTMQTMLIVCKSHLPNISSFKKKIKMPLCGTGQHGKTYLNSF